MLDFEQQANQAQALASLNEDWHLLEDAKMRLEEDLVIRRSRPTMISAKYRAREERRRLLKISAGKLRRIEDPEASLCRSVLINNAVRRLQRENRDDKTRSYGFPLSSYYDDSSKENNSTSNLMDDETSRKRLSDDSRDEEAKRQRHEELDLADDVFSDFFILPPTPRLLSHIDDVVEDTSFFEDRLGNGDPTRSSCAVTCPSSPTGVTTMTNPAVSGGTTTVPTSSNNFYVPDLDEASLSLPSPVTGLGRSSSSSATTVESLMEVVSDVDDRLCDFTRYTDTKTLEERLAELQTLDEHFDIAKFERNNNQSCGRAFHDIQTFHSLVPGLET